jgi:hypothetical protein
VRFLQTKLQAKVFIVCAVLLLSLHVALADTVGARPVIKVYFTEPVKPDAGAIQDQLLFGTIDITSKLRDPERVNSTYYIFKLKEGEYLIRGDYTFKVRAQDIHGTWGGWLDKLFTVGNHVMNFSLIRPKRSVFQTNMNYTVLLQTDVPAKCKYSSNGSSHQTQVWEDMTPFDTDNPSGDYLLYHTTTLGIRPIGPFSPDPRDTNELFVRCEDGVDFLRTHNVTYRFTTDLLDPILKSFVADPNPMYDIPLTHLIASTDEKTSCRYSNRIMEFDNMTTFYIPPRFDLNVSTVQVALPNQDGDYTYYAQCEDLSGRETNRLSVTVTVAITQPLSILSVESPQPPYIVRNPPNNAPIKIKTNRLSYCQYNMTYGSTTTNKVMMTCGSPGCTGSYDTIHKKDDVTIPLTESGLHTFHFFCWVGAGGAGHEAQLDYDVYVDRTAPTMLYVNDSSNLAGIDGEYTYRTDKLYIQTAAQENETHISKFLIDIYRDVLSGSDVRIYHQNQSVDNGDCHTHDGIVKCTFEDWIDDLNLSDGNKYYFRIKAYNYAGLESSTMDSNGVTVDLDRMPNFCADGSRNNNESDIDCGGGTCDSCAINKTCRAYGDCESSFCNPTYFKCKEPICTDGYKNGQETGVDCGGTCKKCGNNEGCLNNADCESGICDPVTHKCKPVDPCTNGRMDPGESDIDCGGACPNRCGDGKICVDDGDCQQGYKCISGKCQLEEITGCVGDADCPLGQRCTNGQCTTPGCVRTNDCDGDGMPDDWERLHGLDPTNPNDASLDSDSDGLSNKEEATWQTDPKNPDTDGDGVTDGDEVKNGWDPKDPNSPGKGMSWLWILLAVLAGIIVVAVGGYFAYTKYGGDKKIGLNLEFGGKKSSLPQHQTSTPFMRPQQGGGAAGTTTVDRRQQQYTLRSKMRETALSSFGGAASGRRGGAEEALSRGAAGEGRDEPITENAHLRTELSKYGDFSSFRPEEINRFRGMTRSQLQTLLSNKNSEQIRLIMQSISASGVRRVTEWEVEEGEAPRKAGSRLSITPDEKRKGHSKSKHALEDLSRLAAEQRSREDVFAQLDAISKGQKTSQKKKSKRK